MSATQTANSDRYGFSDARATRWLWGLIILYTIICAPLGYYRMWHVFRSSVDSGMLSQLLWATREGMGILYSPVRAYSILGESFCPLTLACLPFYMISSHFGLLVVIQSFAIAVCASPDA